LQRHASTVLQVVDKKQKLSHPTSTYKLCTLCEAQVQSISLADICSHGKQRKLVVYKFISLSTLRLF